MSITLTAGPTVSNSIIEAADIIDNMSFLMEVLTAGTTEIVMQLKNGATVEQQAVINGTGFTYTTIGMDTYLTGGTITSIDYDQIAGGVEDLFDFTNMSLDANALFNAIVAEDNGSDIAALENLLLGQDWIYYGNDNVETLLKNSVSVDGIKLNFIGNDVFNLAGGNDRVFAGDGDDTVFGEEGKDKLWGGRGNDLVDGGVGNDTLFGEKGKDFLKGQSGDDTLNGGKAKDKLKGGDGADIFVFDGPKFGKDKIIDFEDGIDLIDMDFASVVITQSGSDALITHADGSVLVKNTLATDLTTDDFV
ncbi:MAG: calcium-binding protein [Rhodobacteraceae bacterium]|nr:calcium-binding protein [Paracoccaceae bacterium]